MKMEQIECSETSAYKIQTPGNHPEENIQHTEHGESLKSKRHCACECYSDKLKTGMNNIIILVQLQRKFCDICSR
jgi:hypothetical protein